MIIKQITHSGRGLGVNKNQPRRVGEILQGMLSSQSPLARGYRAYLASTENAAEKGGVR